jgi:hypothetical protein
VRHGFQHLSRSTQETNFSEIEIALRIILHLTNVSTLSFVTPHMADNLHHFYINFSGSLNTFYFGELFNIEGADNTIDFINHVLDSLAKVLGFRLLLGSSRRAS